MVLRMTLKMKKQQTTQTLDEMMREYVTLKRDLQSVGISFTSHARLDVLYESIMSHSTEDERMLSYLRLVSSETAARPHRSRKKAVKRRRTFV